MLTEVCLGLGSNLGDRQRNIERAVEGLQGMAAHGGRIVVSALYETAPQGFESQPAFLNAACRMWTGLGPFELLDGLRRVQDGLGGRAAFDNGPRAIDIDILLYGRLVLKAPSLVVPHPSMAAREFVLAPLAEIASEVRHPALGLTVGELLAVLRERQAEGGSSASAATASRKSGGSRLGMPPSMG